MKQFFESIPESIEEAARIDGASTFRIFWSAVLPVFFVFQKYIVRGGTSKAVKG